MKKINLFWDNIREAIYFILKNKSIDIHAHFPTCKVNCCHEVWTNSFKIEDGKKKHGRKRSIAHPYTANLLFPHVIVNNKRKKTLNFIAIDNCILDSQDGKKCDCAVYDNKRFCFIEIKEGTAHVGDAVKQLENTLKIFKGKIGHLTDYKLEAILNVGFKRAVPKFTSTQHYHRRNFKINHNAALKEGNVIEF